MKNDYSFQLRVQYKEAEYSTGADIFISNEDARGLLKMTQLTAPSESDDYQMMNEKSFEITRKFVRDLAKRILYVSGASTTTEELLKKFITTDETSY